MPKKIVENTISRPLHLPVLSVKKNNRVITKHFTNTALYLSQDLFSLFVWLVYQSEADNTFKYSDLMLKRYVKSISAAESIYGAKGGLSKDVKQVRVSFLWLVDKGYLMAVGEGVFMVNPMFSFHRRVTNLKYKEVSEKYHKLVTKEFIDYYRSLW